MCQACAECQSYKDEPEGSVFALIHLIECVGGSCAAGNGTTEQSSPKRKCVCVNERQRDRVRERQIKESFQEEVTFKLRLEWSRNLLGEGQGSTCPRQGDSICEGTEESGHGRERAWGRVVTMCLSSLRKLTVARLWLRRGKG